MSFCCKDFAEQAGEPQAPVGGGLLYPPQMRPLTQFERDKDGSWNIYGCCGGGCFVVTNMRFCPYCGAALIAPADITPTGESVNE